MDFQAQRQSSAFKNARGFATIEQNNYRFLVRGQKWLDSALEERIFYIIAVITTIFYLSKYKRLKIVRSELITTIM
ncbi:hypothetical protein A8C32_09455 [Flavivirga aquatica]|uniref:Uncharacterized protein n=1 Tax=Flavivirga aquatica TaxID=1849968 RepID=A0A1E5SJR8_9FLAO|nr:hypothetical protein A8C32_09455 [Flavivirga aquatica]